VSRALKHENSKKSKKISKHKNIKAQKHQNIKKNIKISKQQRQQKNKEDQDAATSTSARETTKDRTKDTQNT
jgi:hypothetical protein